MTKEGKKFISDTKALLKKHGGSIRFVKAKNVYENGQSRAGYFCFDTLEMVIATKRPEHDWLDTMIHESCHFDQYLEKDRTSEALDIHNSDSDANEIFEMWINKVIELNDNQLDTYVKKIIDNERDCEKRAVAKIKKYNLGDFINVDKYIRGANLYCLMHNVVRQKRKWNTKRIPERIKDMFPNTFMKGYEMPEHLAKKIIKECY